MLNCRYILQVGEGRKGMGERERKRERERERAKGRERQRKATCTSLTSSLLRSRIGDFSSLHLLIFFLIS